MYMCAGKFGAPQLKFLGRDRLPYVAYVHGEFFVSTRSLYSSVSIATGYGLYDRGVGVRVPEGSRIFSKSSRPALRFTQSPIQWVRGAVFPGVKRPGREVDHSPPTSAEVKPMWIYTSTPPYAFMA
jgi:hypothetical protein